ncbi:MAG TPA: iron-containing alcohol dehydrogenase [Acidothermaceae bacterium]|jgi:alcohol dehydrogenase class IV
MKDFQYGAPTEIVFGAGARKKLPGAIARLGGSRALIVADRGIAGAGLVEQVASVFDGQPAVSLAPAWTSVPQDPTFGDVEALVRHVRDERVDTVISLGSGSVLAAGRSAGVCAPSTKSVREIAKGGADAPPLLNVAVPTTAGSGGEVSRQATLTDDQTGEKSGVRGWSVAARLAVLDPELLVSVPRSQAVASGIDAMTHALEAYWSKRATVLTDALARPAFKVLVEKLPQSLGSSDTDVLGEMLVASAMANLACGNAGLGLVHGLNKGITGVSHKKGYESVSYGMLHGVLLPWVVDFNRPAAAAKLADLAADLDEYRGRDFDAESGARALLDTLVRWLDELGAPSRLPWNACDEDDLEFIAKDTAGRAMWQDNPRTATEEELKELARLALTDWKQRDWSAS